MLFLSCPAFNLGERLTIGKPDERARHSTPR
jgi:hypothetical protein